MRGRSRPICDQDQFACDADIAGCMPRGARSYSTRSVLNMTYGAHGHREAAVGSF